MTDHRFMTSVFVPHEARRETVDRPARQSRVSRDRCAVASPLVSPRDTASLRLLVVDPSLTQRLWLRAVLGAVGCQVTAVTCIESAVSRYENDPRRFDTVLVATAARRREGRTEGELPWRTHGSLVHVIDRERTAEGVFRARQGGAVDLLARPRTTAEAHSFVERVVASGLPARPEGERGPGFRGSRIPRNDRTRLMLRLREELAMAYSLGQPLTLGVLSLENLPEIKIEEGRESADTILLHFESRLLHGVAPGQFVARHTGCEFAVLMPYCHKVSAAKMLETLATKAECSLSPRSANALPLRVVWGHATATGRRSSYDARALVAGAIENARAHSEQATSRGK